MKRYYITGYKLVKGLRNRELALCIMSAECTAEAMEKAVAHYGTLLYKVTGALEVGSIEAKTWFDGRWGNR